jgi:hypothetical protein
MHWVPATRCRATPGCSPVLAIYRFTHFVICPIALASVLFCSGPACVAQGAARQWANEYEIKAAFVYNLIPFIDWPEGAVGDRFIIGFAGEGPMAGALTSFFKNKRIASKPVEVRDVRTRDELRGCNILLLAYPDRSRTREALLQLQGTNVLTIGDGENFARLGGVVAFVPRENTFQLAINPHAAERAHIKVSSKLMSITKLVPDEEGGGSKP